MTKAIRNRVKKHVVSASYKELKSLLRTNVLNDVTCALFLVSFSQLTDVKKTHRKWHSCDVIKEVLMQ